MMLDSKRYSRYMAVYILATLLLGVTLSGPQANAAGFSVSGVVDFCTNALTKKPAPQVDEFKNLKWLEYSDGDEISQIAYVPSPEMSRIFVETNGNVERIAEGDPRFDQELLRYYRQKKNIGVYKFSPQIKDGQLVLTAEVPSADRRVFLANEPRLLATEENLLNGKVRVTYAHIPALNAMWKDSTGLTVVGVDEDETETFTYLKYLRRNRLVVSLRINNDHDIIGHLLGMQKLVADERWPEFQKAVETLEKIEPQVKKMRRRKQALFEFMVAHLAQIIESSSDTMNKGILDGVPEFIDAATEEFHEGLDNFKREHEEFVNAK